MINFRERFYSRSIFLYMSTIFMLYMHRMYGVIQMDIGQLVLVKAKGNTCKIYCMEKRGQGYKRIMPVINGFVGKKGVSCNKREGDLKTPMGVFKIGYSFGVARAIRTGLEYRQITKKSRWCCNTKSKRYNTWTQKRWESDCEDLWKYRREYKYAAVIEYNMGDKKVSGKGSAIFLHCSTSPTAGCVGAPTGEIKEILHWLNKNENPHIIITHNC